MCEVETLTLQKSMCSEMWMKWLDSQLLFILVDVNLQFSDKWTLVVAVAQNITVMKHRHNCSTGALEAKLEYIAFYVMILMIFG